MNISPEFLPVLVLAFGALLLFLQDVLLEDVTLSRLISIALLLCTTVLSLLLIQSHSHAYIAGDSFLFDSFSQIFGVVFSLSALLVVLTDSQFLKRLSSPFEFYVLVVLATLGMYFVAASTNLIALFVAFEMSTVATYAMTLFDKNNPHSAEAAIKFFVVGALSAGIILYAISLVYLATGSIDLKPSFALISPSASRLLAIGFVLLIVGFGFKVAAVPFHLWLPDTYDGAPYATTTYLASASKVMGFAALLKIFLTMGPSVQALSHLEWRVLFAALSIVTMSVGNLAALVQTRVKRMLAYSSISQSGYILIGLALASSFSYAVLIYFVLSYAVSKAGSFIVADYFETKFGASTFDDYAWLGRVAPLSAFSMSIFLLSLAGIPPLSVFVAKFFMFYAAVKAGGAWIWLAVAGVLNSALSLYYYARLIKNMYMGVANKQPREQAFQESISHVVPIAISLALTIALGLAEAPILGASQHAINSLYQQILTHP
jgi:NADH-quinone oxidoreductase subunit N